jgi:hypothetical protein
LTIGEASQRLADLCDELERQQPELERLMGELQRVVLAYELRYAAVVKASSAGSEDRRKAEAVVAMSTSYLPDNPAEDLATRRAVLEMRLKAQREYGHNVRAEMSALQTVSANLRAEAGLAGTVGRP